eukprot:806253-Rhodomonas_salina.2
MNTLSQYRASPRSVPDIACHTTRAVLVPNGSGYVDGADLPQQHTPGQYRTSRSKRVGCYRV